jgi:hypothetical protein
VSSVSTSSSNAPCRDNGICCPFNQNTCTTASGPTCCNVGELCAGGVCCPSNQNICTTVSGTACCNVGEDCVQGVCCPRAYQVHGQCCPPESQTCCPTGSPSRCTDGGIQTCVNNQWVFSPCSPPRFCAGIPVPNAGVFCEGPPPFCVVGEPSLLATLPCFVCPSQWLVLG